LGGRGRWISEFEASLVYRMSSRTARAAQRNPVLKIKKKKKKKKKEPPPVTEQRSFGLVYEAGSYLSIGFLRKRRRMGEKKASTCFVSGHLDEGAVCVNILHSSCSTLQGQLFFPICINSPR
jgi:hypothetical protein